MLVQTDKILTIIGYIAYPLLLVLLAIFDRALLLRCIVVPAIGFAAVSVFRNIVNAPRPYELSGTKPLIPKDTHGHSFPSRHAFSMFTIACTWMLFQPIVGMVLIVLACVMSAVRVIGGVHFTRDVIAGAIAAITICAIGYLAIPW